MFSLLCHFMTLAVALSSFLATDSAIDDFKQELQRYLPGKLDRVITRDAHGRVPEYVCLLLDSPSLQTHGQ